MRKLVVLLAIFAMTGAIFASPLWAEDHAAPDPADTGNFSHEYGGEFDLFDIILMRPVGLAACVMGLGGAIAGLPFAITSGSAETLSEDLIKKPLKFTFTRPVGEVDF